MALADNFRHSLNKHATFFLLLFQFGCVAGEWHLPEECKNPIDHFGECSRVKEF